MLCQPWPGFQVNNIKNNQNSMSCFFFFFFSGIPNYTSGVPFLPNLSIGLDEIQYVATTCWLAEDHAKILLHK